MRQQRQNAPQNVRYSHCGVVPHNSADLKNIKPPTPDKSG